MSDETKSEMWVVMKAHSWDNLTIRGFPIAPPKEGPHRFMPIFDTREQAVAWNGSEDNVHQLELKPK